MPNEQNRAEEALPRSARGAALLRRVLILAGLALVAMAGLVGGYVVLRELAADGQACEAPDDPAPSSENPPHRPKLFVGWDKPELALVVSGQMHGYMFPCGCSEPQHGGLVRRLTFINELKAKGWDVVGVDLGELPPKLGEGIPRQRELKLEYSMKALDLIGYKAVGIGRTEMGMPLMDALSQYSLNRAQPRPINATLDMTGPKNKVWSALNARPFEILPGSPRLGVASLIGPDLEDSFKNDKSMVFLNNQKIVLPMLYKEFAKQKVEVAMLLHHEYPNNPANNLPAGFLAAARRRQQLAVAIAKEWAVARKKDARIPPLHLLMVLTDEPEPPAALQRVDGTPTHIIDIGHKGKYVGIVGMFRNQDGQVELKYELVKMEPKYEPRPGQPNAVADVLEQYAKQVKDEDLLKQFDFLRSPHPLQVDSYVKRTYGGSTFVGTARCLKCHKDEGRKWQATQHARAFQTLVQKKSPSLRQYDPECVICHTVGFKHPQGYNDLRREDMQALVKQQAKLAQIRAAISVRNKAFEHVGCENCHGPGSAHANGNPADTKLYPLINPFRPTEAERRLAQQMVAAPKAADRAKATQEAKRLFDRRMLRLDGDFCQKCHDLENAVNWTHVPFLERWMEIMHNDPANVGNRWLPRRRPAVVPAVGANDK